MFGSNFIQLGISLRQSPNFGHVSRLPRPPFWHFLEVGCPIGDISKTMRDINRKAPKMFFSHYAWRAKICALHVNKHAAHLARENFYVSNCILEPGFHACTLKS